MTSTPKHVEKLRILNKDLSLITIYTTSRTLENHAHTDNSSNTSWGNPSPSLTVFSPSLELWKQAWTWIQEAMQRLHFRKSFPGDVSRVNFNRKTIAKQVVFLTGPSAYVDSFSASRKATDCKQGLEVSCKRLSKVLPQLVHPVQVGRWQTFPTGGRPFRAATWATVHAWHRERPGARSACRHPGRFGPGSFPCHSSVWVLGSRYVSGGSQRAGAAATPPESAPDSPWSHHSPILWSRCSTSRRSLNPQVHDRYFEASRRDHTLWAERCDLIISRNVSKIVPVETL